MKRFMFLLMISFGIHSLFAQNDPYGLTDRIPNTSLLLSTTGNPLAEMDVKRIFPDIPFELPVLVTHAGDGSDRLFVVEKNGIIKVLENDYTSNQYKIFLDIVEKVNSGPNEAGLLGLAFHPQYADNGKFYIYYNYGNLFSRISEFSVSQNPDAADLNSERVLLVVSQPAGNHNGGHIAFGPDGYLYIGLGDGGSAGDPWGNGQNLETLLGTMLRIDVDRQENNLEYAIPADNPFAGNTNGWHEEIYAYGLRNPWRFSFDRETGLLWAGDVGQNAWEEIDIIEKGGNYGWNIMEGFHCYEPSTNCDTTGLKMPVIEYAHFVGRSVTGGYVYRGLRLVRLKGIYIYADFTTRKIWGLRYENGEAVENRLLAECPSQVSAFGEDESGELIIVGYNGRLYIFDEKEGNPPPFPKRISESGLFQDIENQTFSPGLIPYSVNSQLWSDGALKTRLIALPETTKIEFSQDDHWQFPENSVIVKNFYLEMEKGNPESNRIIETRFLVKRTDSDAWDGFSYLWDDAETDAVLIDDSAKRFFVIEDENAPGGSYQQTYYYPSRSDCILCHTPAAGYLLGVRTAQINKKHLYDTVEDNQLRSFNHIRLFTSDIGEDYSDFPKLPDPLNENETLESRARSYLDANCANCHRPEGTGRTNMDLRYDTSRENTNLVDVIATLGNMDVQGALRVKSGSPEKSILYLRMIDLGKFRMPPLASSVVDTQGTKIIRDWIRNLSNIDIDEQDQKTEHLPGKFRLFPIYPNPFNPSTNIKFEIYEPAHVTLNLYDITGREVETLVDQPLSEGDYQILWNASKYTSGLYYCRLKADELSEAKKVILLK
ncbi:T9SS type A sorting domain-containing protein [candidate division KSB1 bacterium]|nr:T9SS type A sorting domain-containing protein [candidate division KSB1 bacterium]